MPLNFTDTEPTTGCSLPNVTFKCKIKHFKTRHFTLGVVTTLRSSSEQAGTELSRDFGKWLELNLETLCEEAELRKTFLRVNN